MLRTARLPPPPSQSQTWPSPLHPLGRQPRTPRSEWPGRAAADSEALQGEQEGRGGGADSRILINAPKASPPDPQCTHNSRPALQGPVLGTPWEQWRPLTCPQSHARLKMLAHSGGPPGFPKHRLVWDPLLSPQIHSSVLPGWAQVAGPQMLLVSIPTCPAPNLGPAGFPWGSAPAYLLPACWTSHQ